MPRALQVMTAGSGTPVLHHHPDTPVRGARGYIPLELGLPSGAHLDGFGHVLATLADRPGAMANQVFSPREMLTRMARIRRRIRREGGTIGAEKQPSGIDWEGRQESYSRTGARTRATEKGLTLVDCCLCRRPLAGVTTPPTVVTRIERAARKDSTTGLSYCRRCADTPVTVQLIDTPPDSGKD